MSLNLDAFWHLGDDKRNNYSLVIAKKDMPLFAEYLAAMLKDTAFEQSLLNSNDNSAQTKFLKFCYSNVITSAEYSVYEQLYRNLKNDAAIIDTMYAQVSKSLNVNGALTKMINKCKYAFGSSDWLDNLSDIQQSNSEKLLVLEQYNQLNGPQSPFYFDMNRLEAPKTVPNVYTWIAKNPIIGADGRVQLNGGIELTARYLTLSTISEEGRQFEFIRSEFTEEELGGTNADPSMIRLFQDYKGGPYRMPVSAGEKFHQYWTMQTKKGEPFIQAYGRIFTNSTKLLQAIADNRLVQGIGNIATGIAGGAGIVGKGISAKLGDKFNRMALVSSDETSLALKNRLLLLVNTIGRGNIRYNIDDYDQFEESLKSLRKDSANMGQLEDFEFAYRSELEELAMSLNLMNKRVQVGNLLPYSCKTDKSQIDCDTIVNTPSVDLELWALICATESSGKQEVEQPASSSTAESTQVEQLSDEYHSGRDNKLVQALFEKRAREAEIAKTMPEHLYSEFTADLHDTLEGNDFNKFYAIIEAGCLVYDLAMSNMTAFEELCKLNVPMLYNHIANIGTVTKEDIENWRVNAWRPVSKIISKYGLQNEKITLNDNPAYNSHTGKVVDVGTSDYAYVFFEPDELENGPRDFLRFTYPDKAKLKRIQNVARYVQTTFDDCLGESEMCKLLGTIDESSDFREEEISQIDEFYSSISSKIRDTEEVAKVFLDNYDNTVILEPTTTGTAELDAYAQRLGDLFGLKTTSNFSSGVCIGILTQAAIDKMDVSKYESWKKFIPAQFLPMFQNKFEVDAGKDAKTMQSIISEQSQPYTYEGGGHPITVVDVEPNEVREFQQKEQVIQTSSVYATEDDVLDLYDDEPKQKPSVLNGVVEFMQDPLGTKKMMNGIVQTVADVAKHSMDTRADIIRAEAERQRALGDKQAVINQSKTQNIVAKGTADEQRITARGNADEKRINAAGNAASSVIDSAGTAATNVVDATGHAIDNAGSGLQKAEGTIREVGKIAANANGIPMK